jgi:uncharacterized protein (TIGR02996 family)
MARYEDGKSFWHIALVGTGVIVTTGKLGHKGRTTTKELQTPGAARAHHDDLVLAKVRAGFKPVVFSPAAAPDGTPNEQLAELEAQLAEDPEDPEAWVVYSDYLQRIGDPRGEFAALLRAAEAARAADPRATKSSARLAANKYFAKHAPALLGALARFVPTARDPLAPPFIWRNGVIHRVELVPSEEESLLMTLEEVLTHRSGRLVGELSLRVDTRTEAMVAVEEIVVQAPPLLQEIDLFAKTDLGDELLELWRAVPRLRRVYLTAKSIELAGGLDRLTELRRARFFALSMSPSTIRAIATAVWPKLERLELRLGVQLGRESPAFADLEPLFSRTDLPALTHLKIRRAPFAGAIARAVAAGPLAAKLAVLDLCHGSFTPNDTRALAQLKSRFTNLRELWVPAGTDTNQLAGIAKHVVLDARAPIDTLEDDLVVRYGGERFEGIRE